MNDGDPFGTDINDVRRFIDILTTKRQRKRSRESPIKDSQSLINGNQKTHISKRMRKDDTRKCSFRSDCMENFDSTDGGGSFNEELEMILPDSDQMRPFQTVKPSVKSQLYKDGQPSQSKKRKIVIDGFDYDEKPKKAKASPTPIEKKDIIPSQVFQLSGKPSETPRVNGVIKNPLHGTTTPDVVGKKVELQSDSHRVRYVTEESWCDKYAPKSVRKCVGNEKANIALESWMNSHFFSEKSPEKSKQITDGVMIVGPPGSGKTARAFALAAQFRMKVKVFDSSTKLEIEEPNVKPGAKYGSTNVGVKTKKKSPITMILETVCSSNTLGLPTMDQIMNIRLAAAKKNQEQAANNKQQSDTTSKIKQGSSLYDPTCFTTRAMILMEDADDWKVTMGFDSLSFEPFWESPISSIRKSTTSQNRGPSNNRSKGYGGMKPSSDSSDYDPFSNMDPDVDGLLFKNNQGKSSYKRMPGDEFKGILADTLNCYVKNGESMLRKVLPRDRIPLIITGRESYGDLKELSKHVLVVQLSAIDRENICNMLIDILNAENIAVDSEAISAIASYSRSDIRKSIQTLQSCCVLYKPNEREEIGSHFRGFLDPSKVEVFAPITRTTSLKNGNNHHIVRKTKPPEPRGGKVLEQMIAENFIDDNISGNDDANQKRAIVRRFIMMQSDSLAEGENAKKWKGSKISNPTALLQQQSTLGSEVLDNGVFEEFKRVIGWQMHDPTSLTRNNVKVGGPPSHMPVLEAVLNPTNTMKRLVYLNLSELLYKGINSYTNQQQSWNSSYNNSHDVKSYGDPIDAVVSINRGQHFATERQYVINTIARKEPKEKTTTIWLDIYPSFIDAMSFGDTMNPFGSNNGMQSFDSSVMRYNNFLTVISPVHRLKMLGYQDGGYFFIESDIYPLSLISNTGFLSHFSSYFASSFIPSDMGAPVLLRNKSKYEKMIEGIQTGDTKKGNNDNEGGGQSILNGEDHVNEKKRAYASSFIRMSRFNQIGAKIRRIVCIRDSDEMNLVRTSAQMEFISILNKWIKPYELISLGYDRILAFASSACENSQSPMFDFFSMGMQYISQLLYRNALPKKSLRVEELSPSSTAKTNLYVECWQGIHMLIYACYGFDERDCEELLREYFPGYDYTTHINQTDFFKDPAFGQLNSSTAQETSKRRDTILRLSSLFNNGWEEMRNGSSIRHPSPKQRLSKFSTMASSVGYTTKDGCVMTGGQEIDGNSVVSFNIGGRESTSSVFGNVPKRGLKHELQGLSFLFSDLLVRFPDFDEKLRARTSQFFQTALFDAYMKKESSHVLTDTSDQTTNGDEEIQYIRTPKGIFSTVFDMLWNGTVDGTESTATEPNNETLSNVRKMEIAKRRQSIKVVMLYNNMSTPHNNSEYQKLETNMGDNLITTPFGIRNSREDKEDLYMESGLSELDYFGDKMDFIYQ